MKNIVKSLLIVVAVAAIAGGATYAYFSDTETISGNTFSAGTMVLRIDSNASSAAYTWSDGFTSNASFSNLKPGDNVSGTDKKMEQIIDIMNVGGIDGYATIDLNRTSFPKSDLAGVLNFHIYYDGNHDGIFDETGLNGTIDDFTQAYTLGPIVGNSADLESEAGKIASVKIVWSVPTSAGNEIQGDSVTINAVFGLEQNR